MSKPNRIVKFVLPLALAALGALSACHAGARVGPVHGGAGVSYNAPAAQPAAKTAVANTTAVAQAR